MLNGETGVLLISASLGIRWQSIPAKKELTPTEQLEYKVALLECELLKKDGEIMRLKKSIELERGGASSSSMVVKRACCS